MRFTRTEPCAPRQPFLGELSAHHSACRLLQTLSELRLAVRSLAIMLSALLLLLTTVGESGAFPKFDLCPERVAHAQHEHAFTGSDHHGAQQDQSHAPLSHADPAAAHANSADDHGGYCECCKGFFLAHLSAIPVAITVPIFPDRSVDHSGLHRMALEFASAPPVPPPQPYRV